MLEIGDTIWRFDQNRRVYAKGNGHTSGPIYREHWEPIKITGETSRSWCAGYSADDLRYKIPKSGDHTGWALSEKELDDACWLNDYMYAIVEAVRHCKNPDKIRQVAAIVGWSPR